MLLFTWSVFELIRYVLVLGFVPGRFSFFTKDGSIICIGGDGLLIIGLAQSPRSIIFVFGSGAFTLGYLWVLDQRPGRIPPLLTPTHSFGKMQICI